MRSLFIFIYLFYFILFILFLGKWGGGYLFTFPILEDKAELILHTMYCVTSLIYIKVYELGIKDGVGAQAELFGGWGFGGWGLWGVDLYHTLIQIEDPDLRSG